MRVLGIGKETSFKSGATPDLWLDLVGHSVSVRRENLWLESAWHRTPHTMLGGPYVAEGDIDLILTPHGTLRLVYLAMGRLASTEADDDTSPTAWKHDIKITDDQLPTAEFDIFFDNYNFKVLGAVVRRLEISMVARELVAATVGILGAKVQVGTGGGSSPAEEKPWYPSTVVVKKDGTEIPGKVQAFRLTIENSVADDAHVLGSLELPNMFTQGVEVSGEIEIQFSDWDEYQSFLGGSEPQQEVSPCFLEVYIYGDETGSTVADFERHCMKIFLSRCYYTESDVHFTRRERVVQRISFKAASKIGDVGAPLSIWIYTTRSEP